MLRSLAVGSPVGTLDLVASETHLLAVLWPQERIGRVLLGAALPAPRHPLLQEAAHQLGAYFAGQRRRFDLPLEFRGTAFQRRLWLALIEIPWGQTRSYGQMAEQLGLPRGAARAIGAANGRNPLSIIAPCHRLVGHDGRLTGFAGGLDAKRFLLELEAA